ncbi:hypothetical protein C8F04DRAFT_42224 [Mycena alexandri]|uniref:F-box domain-containing protein n=1 Tax=Mycena alexandri TaxID=1745969 RepID=A0AAD6SLW9_9AGAR|nr:hypothetical protein C8F04DRAFT_42224 [Mycena alexandri]
MSSFALGPLSHRKPEYQKQNSLVVDRRGRLRFAALSRRTLALPLEILAEIFLHSLPPDDFISPSLSSAPLVLCGVCCRWREIALSTPRLWNSLVLDMQLARKRTAYVELYQSWLSRARSTPISLALQDTDDADFPRTVFPLLQTIARLSPQWRNIDVDLGVYLARILFSSNGDIDPFPLLEKLGISRHHNVAQSNLTISFCDAPKLREIFAPVYNSLLPMLFPWTQITRVRTGDILLSHCLEIFRNASHLVSCTFEVRDDGSALPTSIISLPHLQCLTLAGMLVLDANRIPTTILDCLKTPALENLSLQFAYFYGSHTWTADWDVSPFLSFLSRSSCQLRTLALSLMPTTTETFIQCLKATPTVVHLKLEPLQVVDRTTMFAQLTADAAFLPKLETLDIFSSKHTGFHRVDPSVIVKMLCWRWAADGITQLRSFQMLQTSKSCTFDSTVHPECRRLEQEGMILCCGVKQKSFQESIGLRSF